MSCRQLAQVHLGDQHLVVALAARRRGSPGTGSASAGAHARPCRPCRARGARRRAPGRTSRPTRARAGRRPPGGRPRDPGTSMPATFCARSCVIRSWFSASYETLPVSFAFSSPPMRCSRPGVPGIAHGRASVSRVALVGQERLAVRGRELDLDRRERADVGDPPRLGAVREVRVGEQVDRRAVGERDAHRLDRGVEAVARRRRRDHRARATRSCGRRAPSAGRPAPASSACRSTGRRAARR